MTDLRLLPEEERSRIDVITTWILRIGVAVVFVSIGRSKFDDSSMWVRLFERIGLGQWFRYLTGVLQIAGGLLVLIPRTFLIGIGVLACTMAGAVIVWLVVFGAVGNAIIPGIVLVALVGVGLHGARLASRTSAKDAPPSGS
jgi:uncharacterized membrane protein YphA (DoxX/SURF4 family)